MKPKTIAIVILCVFGLLIGIIAARADDPTTALVWDANDPRDRVMGYIVQFRPQGGATNTNAWASVSIASNPAPTVVLPASPFRTEFRLAASNSLGLSPWSETLFLPAAVRGIRLVLPLSP